MVSNINLVSPEVENKSLLTGKSSLILAVVLVVVVLIVYLVVSFLAGSYKSQRADLENEIQKQKNYLAGSNYADLCDFQGKLTVLSQMMSSHVAFDTYLRNLSRYVLPETRLSSLSWNANDGKFTFKGLTPNFEALTRSVLLLKSDPDLGSLEFKGASQAQGAEGASGLSFEAGAAIQSKTAVSNK